MFQTGTPTAKGHIEIRSATKGSAEYISILAICRFIWRNIEAGCRITTPNKTLNLTPWDARMTAGMVIDGWQPGEFADASKLAYKHAVVQGGQRLTSVQYLKASTTKSYYILVMFGGSMVSFMAKVLLFVKVASGVLPPLRLAMCELYSVEQQQGAVGTLWHVKAFDSSHCAMLCCAADRGRDG